MTELIYFLRFLKRRVYILLLVPLLAMAAAYFLTARLPDLYRSHGRIATGIVDKTDQIITSEKDEQEQEINRKFDNIIQLMRMKKVVDQVSYKLLLHDLSTPSDSVFSADPKILESLDEASRRRAAALVSKKYEAVEELSPWNPEEAEYLELMDKLGFSHSALLSDLTIYRLASSDYIAVEFEGENPRLTAFVINSLYEEFLKIYSNRLKESSTRSLEFLEKEMLGKLATMNARMEELKQFKIRNKVLNLNEQARSLYGHIIDFETRREIARKDVVAYTAALRNIDNRFDPADRRYVESALTDINRRITTTRDMLRAANEDYIRSNFDGASKSRLDSLQGVLSRQINEASDTYVYNPMVSKGNLVSHKLELEISLELAKNSITSIENEVNRLNRKYEGMVPNEASIQQYETSIDIAGKEYIEALQRYNNARLESYAPITLKLVESAMPGISQPSKKALLVIVSGIASFVLCLFVFFVTYFLDNAVRTPFQLADVTGIPVLGRINRVSGGRQLAEPEDDGSKAASLFRDLIRSVRYEIDEDAGNPKVISVTSLAAEAGKTTLIYGLAWAYAKVHRSVLIIDGNFTNPELSAQQDTQVFLEDFLRAPDLPPLPAGPGGADFLATRGGDVSLLELADEGTIQEKLARLRQRYDVILIETPALTTFNKAKEWLLFSDRIVVAFESGNTLKDGDKAKLMYLRSRGAVLSGWVLTGTGYEVEPVGKALAKI